MMQVYRELSSCAPSRRPDVYVYSIKPLADQSFAAITSADELLLLPKNVLPGVDAFGFPNVPHGLTGLATADAGNTVICSATDGEVAIFDLRTRSRTGHFKLDKPVNALACRGDDVAAGGEAIVAVWDRKMMRRRWQNGEVNDEITALDFHPSRDNLLLSGGDDGLVSVFDTHIVEEDDSLLQAVNYGPIHKAGFLGASNLYALSSDQQLALHSLTLDDDDTSEPPPDQLGDLRPVIPCEYVIDVFPSGLDHVVACGSHSQSRVDLVKVERGKGLDLDHRIVLDGAHGEEVVRSIFVDEATGLIYTAGEDGRIAVFRATESDRPMSPAARGSKTKKGLVGEARYKPY